MVGSPWTRCPKRKGSRQDPFAATSPMRDAIAISPCPTGSQEPPQSRPTSRPQRNGVPRPSDARPAGSPPLGERARHLQTPRRIDRATARCIAIGQSRRMRKAQRRFDLAALSKNDAAECRKANWRTGNDHRSAPRIAMLRRASPVQDPRPNGALCQEPTHNAKGSRHAVQPTAEMQSPPRPGHGRSTRAGHLRVCSLYR